MKDLQDLIKLANFIIPSKPGPAPCGLASELDLVAGCCLLGSPTSHSGNNFHPFQFPAVAPIVALLGCPTSPSATNPHPFQFPAVNRP